MHHIDAAKMGSRVFQVLVACGLLAVSLFTVDALRAAPVSLCDLGAEGVCAAGGETLCDFCCRVEWGGATSGTCEITNACLCEY